MTIACSTRDFDADLRSRRKEEAAQPARAIAGIGRQRHAGQRERGDQRHHLETAAENHLEEGGVAAGDKSQAAAKPSGEAELTRYETAVQQDILGGNDALDHRITSSGEVQYACHTVSPER